MCRLTFAYCVAITTIIAAAVLAQQPHQADPAAAPPSAPLPDDLPKADFPEPLPPAPSPPVEPGAMRTQPSDISPAAGTEAAAPPVENRQACVNAHQPRGLSAWWQYHLKPCLQYTHWGYADLFEEPAFGASVRATWKTQVCRGLAAQMVLYRYDFCPASAPDCAQLNTHGRRRFQEISSMMRCCGFSCVLIETSGDANMDAARRNHVLKLFAETGFPVPEEWVVVGTANAPGLRGEEAILIDKNVLGDVKNGNKNGAQGGGGVGGGTGLLMTAPMGGGNNSGSR